MRDGGSPYLDRAKKMLVGKSSSQKSNLEWAIEQYEKFNNDLPVAMAEFSVTSDDATRYIELVGKAELDPVSFSQEEVTEMQGLQNKIQSVASFLIADKDLSEETINLISNE
jgi:hypothetical protein